MAAQAPSFPTGSSAVIGAVPVANLDSLNRRQFLANLELYIPLAFVVLLAFFCFLGPYIFPIPNPGIGNILRNYLPPFSRGAILGTDAFGDDMLARILYGGRISLEVGMSAQAIGFIIGPVLGILAAYKGGFIGSLIMRIMDALLSLPGLVISIMIVTYLGPSELHVIYAIAFFSVPALARLSRAHALRVKEREFITAARLAGQKDRWIVLRHLAPNVYPSLLTFFFLGIGVAIVLEAGLSFLGLGIPQTTPTWGNMIAAGEQNYGDPWLVLVPSTFLFFTILALNLLGDAIRARISSS